eukprot:c10481_g1_i1 orf=170-1759(-)
MGLLQGLWDKFMWLSPLPTLGVCFLGLAYLWLRSSRARKSGSGDHGRLLPPGPRGLPIIGHMHLLGTLPHQAFARLSKTYGPLMHLRLGAVPLVVASTPEMAMQVLQTHDKVMAGRPQNMSIPKTIFRGPDILFSPPGPYWKLMRQICVTDFFSNKRLEYFRPLRTDEVGRLMLSILEAEGTPYVIRQNVQSANNNVMSRMAIGKRLREITSGGAAENIVSIIVEVIGLVGAFNLADYVPSLAWMDLQGYGKRSKEVSRKAHTVFQEVIEKRRAIRSADDAPRDFLDLLLQAALNSKHKELHLEDNNIRTMLIDMFAGGTDTAAVTTEWALAELFASPKKLEIVREELDRVVGKSRLVNEADIPNLTYLLAVVMETMRIHPVAPLLAPHMAMEACQIGDYHIPANTVVYVNVWAIHRDPNVWDNPLEFRPERFVNNSKIDFLGQQFEYLPFGSGRRFCPGWKLGLLSVQLALSNLLHAFDWTIPTVPLMTEKFGIVTTKEEPLVATPRPRLARHLYDGYKVSPADAIPS